MTVFAAVGRMIEDELARRSVPSCAVAVAQGGEVVWEAGFGWADVARLTPANAHTMYSAASVTKPFTGTALMVLHERGLLDLDRPVDEYLGAASVTAPLGGAADATVRRLANHTAGLGLHYQFFYGTELAVRPSREETLARYGVLVTKPDERFCYSNLGYGVLDHVLAQVSGASYEDVMRIEVFEALGLTRCAIGIPEELTPVAALRYGHDGVAYPPYDVDHPGGSSLYCSMHDLAMFGQFHLGMPMPAQSPILQPSALAQMRAPASTGNADCGYALGWGAIEQGGYRMQGHTGLMGGASANIRIVPSAGLCVAVATNAMSDLPQRVTNRILAELLPGFGETIDEAGLTRPPTARGGPPPEPAELPHGRWVGHIATYERELDVMFAATGRAIEVTIDGGQPLALQNANYDAATHVLTGLVSDTIPTADAQRRPHVISFDLRMRDGGDALTGAAIAFTISTAADGGAPDARFGNALGHWTYARRG